MSSTIILAAVFIGTMLVSIFVWALLLRLGLRWAKVADVTTRRIALATLVVLVLQIVFSLLFLLVIPSFDVESIVLGILETAVSVSVACLVISWIFQTRFLRALQAWLPTLLASFGTVAFLLFVLRPFIYDAFVVPTNGMAPTLVGIHWQGVCPECSQPNYCSPVRERIVLPNPPRMICDNFHVTQVAQNDERVHSADRFLIAKFLRPRRWDLVVFQLPEDPTILYVMRLVSLPGERIHIEDGSVWIDGKKQEPPDSIRGIEYLSQLPDWKELKLWGSVDRPALLGPDEYFVLGDFSAQSRDSRWWEQGTPGHNPFAAPESYLKGVVTHTYWPLHRWRIHR